MFKSALKAFGVLLPAVGALVASSPVGAAAVGGGAGAVTGSVVLSPGFGLVPSLGQQSFTFNSIAIDGVFAGVDSTGPVTATCVTTTLNAANVTGAGSVDGSIAADFGGVNAFTASGNCTNGGTVTYSTSAAGGTFVRVGGLVYVLFLGGQCTIIVGSGGVSATCELGVIAEFNPTNPPNDLKDFSFRGAYAAAG